MQKVHQSSVHKNELTMFLIIAFICSFLFSAANLIFSRIRKKDTAKLFDKKAKPALLAALFIFGGIGIALNNLINLYLSGVVDSVIFFPIVNGGGLVLITIASLIFFKEKLTPKQWAGMGFGIAATVMLCV